MSGRYQQFGPRDSELSQDGDRIFLGVDMRRDPELLEPGIAALAINKTFNQGRADTRLAMRTVTWARELGLNFPMDFPVNFSIQQGFGKVYGSITFSDPYGQERTILACEKLAYQICNGAPIGTILYPNGQTLDESVSFTQAFNVLLLWRGTLKNPWKFETGLDFNADFAFAEVPDETNEDYTSTIPNSARGICMGNRVWTLSGLGNSEVSYSDLLAYTRYDAAFSNIYLNSGNDDYGICLFPFGSAAILGFKTQSICAINNVLPNPSTDSFLEVITTERGCIAPNTPVQAGKDVLFLADNGVYAISQVLDNRLQAVTEPISAPLQPLFDRINWAYARNAQAVVHGNRYLLTVPLDGSTYNNAVIVYNFINQSWEGWWEGKFLDVGSFFRADVNGERRLFVVNDSNLADTAKHGAVFLLDGGFTDVCFEEEVSIADMFRTRAFTAGSKGVKAWLGASLEIDTWYGAATISLVRSGVNETGEVGSFTKDRTKFYLFGKPDYDVTNAGEDHGEPYRQDYSVELTENQSWVSGINPGLHQRSKEAFRLRERATSLQIEIKGTRGRNCVASVLVDASADRDPQREVI